MAPVVAADAGPMQIQCWEATESWNAVSYGTFCDPFHGGQQYEPS